MISRFVTCAPSRLEAAALASGMTPGTVVRTGVGPSAARRAADSAAVRRAGVVTVAGIAGALVPELAAGDVVVATEVRGPEGPVPCPSAPLLAGELRRAGFAVHLGPIASADHVVAGPERATQHARHGALCVDMETDWVLAGAATPYVSAVRVVADVATRPLARPTTVARLWTALRTLPRLGPCLTAWGAAAGERELLLAGPRSFCAGVVRAIEVVERALEQRDAPIYVRKQIVHNVHVVSDLQRRGAVFVESLDEVPAGATVVFSAHGVSPSVRQEAAARGLDVIDATCPLVSKVHADVRRYADDGDTVIFIGHEGHEETVGAMGERAGRTVLVQDAVEAATVEVADPERVSYQMQTTLAAGDVAAVVEVLRRRFPRLRAPSTDGICYATTNRQRALQSVAVDADLVLVLGSQNSSNSQRLVELADRLGRPAHLINDASDIQLGWLREVGAVGITAGASAPAALVDDVVAALGGLGPTRVVERTVTTEDIHFTVPKEVRAS
jgi:4-hydroxy-3-methylbut-2-enyl diphosphate reductase